MTATPDLMQGLAELDAAYAGYVEAEEFYDGTVDEHFASAALAVLLSKGSGHYDLNFAKIPVNVMAKRLEIVSVSVVDGDKPNEVATQRLEDEFIKPNKLGFFFKDLFEKVCQYGDAYAFVWPDRGEDTDSVRAYYNDPKQTRAIYSDDDPNTPLFVIKSWWIQDTLTGQKRRRAVLYYADHFEHWISLTEKPEKPQDWTTFNPIGPDGELVDGEDIVNTYQELTIFHFRNASPYGVPEHKDAYGPQRAINKLSTSLMATSDYAVAPQRYVLQDENAMLNGRGTDAPAWGDSTTGQDVMATDGDDDSRLVGGPGELWTLFGRSAGEFSAAQLSTFITGVEFYARAAAQLTNTPFHYFDPSGDVPSGESLKVANAPLDDDVADIQERLEDTTIEFYECALMMLGITGTVSVTWKPSEVTLSASDWATVRAKIDAGVPQKIALVEAGYTGDEVDAWLKEQHEDMDITRRVQLLAQLGAALTELGQAVTMGTIDENTARLIADVTLGQLAPVDPKGDPELPPGPPKFAPIPSGQPAPAPDPVPVEA